MGKVSRKGVDSRADYADQMKLRMENVIAETPGFDWPEGKDNYDKINIQQKVTRYAMNECDQAIVLVRCSWQSRNFRHTYCFDGRFTKLLFYYVDVFERQAELIKEYQGFAQDQLIKKPHVLQLEIDPRFTPDEARILLLDSHQYEKLSLSADANISDILQAVEAEDWESVPAIHSVLESTEKEVHAALHTINIKL